MTARELADLARKNVAMTKYELGVIVTGSIAEVHAFWNRTDDGLVPARTRNRR